MPRFYCKCTKYFMSLNNLNKHYLKCLLNTFAVKSFVNNITTEIINKQQIINLFISNVKGKQIILNNINNKNDGKEGHWLENQMNIKHNCLNKPDIYGYEMKKDSNKITFGDFGASEYLFSKNKEYINLYNNLKINITRTEFIKIFGKSNLLKNNRFSWSGSCIPRYNIYNNYGQILTIVNNDIHILYSYTKDTRIEKNTFPDYFKETIILIAVWKKEKLKKCVNDKFNCMGFFICKKNKKIPNVYDKICFGNPFNFEYFIENIKNGLIIFDSGMYDGNARNYSHFRSYKNFWYNMITEEY